MNNKILTKILFILYRTSPLFIVYLLYEVAFIILKPVFGTHLAYITSTYLPMLYLIIITAFGYFGGLPFCFIVVSQISVFCCGINNCYQIFKYWCRVFPSTISFNIFVNCLVDDSWHFELFRLILFGLAPMALTIASIRVVMKSTKISRKELKKHAHTSSNAFGSARFANKKEIEQLNSKSGIVVGKQATLWDYSDPDKIVRHIKTKKSSKKIIYQQPVHALLIAPSGYGKGVGVIMGGTTKGGIKFRRCYHNNSGCF